MSECKCGCGRVPSKGKTYVSGHNMRDRAGRIRPAGMTYERALEIAVQVHDRRIGNPVSDEKLTTWTEIKRLNSLGLTDVEVAGRVGIGTRQINRLRPRLGLQVNSHGGAPSLFAARWVEGTTEAGR